MPLSRHLSRATLLVALAVAGLAAPASGPAVAETPAPGPADGTGTSTTPAAGLVSFGIAPAGAEHPDDRAFIQVAAAPGSTVYEHVALLNQGSAPVTLRVYGADGLMADGGGLTVGGADDPVDAGTWIDLGGVTEVEVPAQAAETGFGYVILPIALTVPADAEPGDHVAGLVASLDSPGTAGTDTPAIELQQRVAARVYVQVAGALDPGLAVEGVHATWSGTALGTGTAAISYTLRNTGNARVAVDQQVRVAGPFGLGSVETDPPRVDDLLPGGTTDVTVEVDALPLVLESVQVTAHARQAAAGIDPGDLTATGTTRLLAVPWLWVALLLLLVVAVVLLLARRRRRRAARRSRTAQREARRALLLSPAARPDAGGGDLPGAPDPSDPSDPSGGSAGPAGPALPVPAAPGT